jgi:SpoVK/Ycf46/Vps4 family AAA+-type ATPase
MMEAAPIKQSQIRARSFSSQSLFIEIPSDEETTFLLCARHGTGKTTLAKSSFQPTLTSDTSLKKFGATLK